MSASIPPTSSNAIAGRSTVASGSAPPSRQEVRTRPSTTSAGMSSSSSSSSSGSGSSPGLRRLGHDADAQAVGELGVGDGAVGLDGAAILLDGLLDLAAPEEEPGVQQEGAGRGVGRLSGGLR